MRTPTPSPKWLTRSAPVFFFATVFMTYGGARQGAPWRGLVVMLVMHAVYISFTADKGRRVLLVLVAGAMGFAVECGMAITGFYTIAEPGRWMIPAPWCPEWMLVLWLNFGFFLYEYTMRMLGKVRYTTILGIVFALMIYSNAARMHTITLRAPVVLSVAVGALLWAMVVPVLYWTGQKLTTYSRDSAIPQTSESTDGGKKE